MLWFKIVQSAVLGIYALVRFFDTFGALGENDATGVLGNGCAALVCTFLAIGIWFFV